MTNPITWRRESVLDFYNLLLGAFLFASPWLVASSSGPLGKEAWVGGALIVVISAAALVVFARWQQWSLLVLGLWLAVSPRVLGFHNVKAMKISVDTGVLVAHFAALELYLIYESARQQAGAPRPNGT